MDKYVTVTITPEGDTKIEAHGFTDGRCRDATRDLETALGLVADRSPKTGDRKVATDDREKVSS